MPGHEAVFTLYQLKNDKMYFFQISAKNAPCIGLCFHNKLMALEAETAGGNEVPDANELDFSRGWPLNGAEFEKPCVGVCQYFRENNMVNPFITPKPIVMAET